MSNYPGMGVMIGMLGGNESTVNAHNNARGKRIKHLEVKDDELVMDFDDGSGIRIRDEGQSCCEHRYMVCDDDLRPYIGSSFTGCRIQDAPDQVDDYGETHEVQFLLVDTSEGTFTVATHNEHNGYYGGFWITISEKASPLPEPPQES